MRLINADELTCLLTAMKGWGRTDSERELVQVAINTIAGAPAVNAVLVRHGRWVTKQRRDHWPSGQPYEADYCSECGKRGSREYAYCLNCGAKIDGCDKEDKPE